MATTRDSSAAPINRSAEKGTRTDEGSLQQQVSSNTDPESQVASVSSNDVFGNEEGAEIQYKTCSWWHVSILMIAENISLGVLALPQALAILGLVPGLLCIFFLGIIATYTGYLLGHFKLSHPSVQSFAECGYIIAGPIGREVMTVGQAAILVFIMGAHVLSFGVAMNVLTDHATCTIVFSVVGLIICFVLGLPRTFKNVSFLSVASCLSIIVAVIVAMIGIGITKPDAGNVRSVEENVPLAKGLGAVMNIVLAFSGHVGFLAFQAELKNPRDFNKALFVEQGFAVTFYMAISVVLYYYAGPNVTSPALGSASPIVTKVAFGLALPTIIIAGTVNGSVACKNIYLRVWKGTDVVHQKNFKSLGSWWGICAGAWLAAWLLAEAIPNFEIFLGFIGAMLGSWFSVAIPPFMCLYQYWGKLFSSKRMIAWTMLNTLFSLLGVTIFCLGMWSSIDALAHGEGGEVFSCKNNWDPKTLVA